MFRRSQTSTSTHIIPASAGLNIEKLHLKGRGVRFDLLIEALTPSGMVMFLNIEIQRAFYSAETIFRRAWKYVSSIFSELTATFAAAKDATVCGLWILTHLPKKLKNSVTYLPPLYDVQKTYSEWSAKERKYATILQNVMICAGAGDPDSPHYEEVADFVPVLLDAELASEKKIQIFGG